MNTTRGDRLRQERERLGIGQVPFAEACGVKKRAQFNYEQGERDPDADYLARCLALGVDVLYVLTGDRNGSNRATSNELPADERKLLKRYRALGELQRQQAFQMIEVIALGGSMGGNVQSTGNVSATAPGSVAVGNVNHGVGVGRRRERE